jgi:transcriptional regulator with XRE-family HTH domain
VTGDPEQGAVTALGDVAIVPQFHTRLRELRTARGLSQNALARTACVSKSYLSELESDVKTPSFTTARALDVALGAGGELAGLVPTVPPRARPAARLAQAVGAHLPANGLADAIAEKVIERLEANQRERP